MHHGCFLFSNHPSALSHNSYSTFCTLFFSCLFVFFLACAVLYYTLRWLNMPFDGSKNSFICCSNPRTTHVLAPFFSRPHHSETRVYKDLVCTTTATAISAGRQVAESWNSCLNKRIIGNEDAWDGRTFERLRTQSKESFFSLPEPSPPLFCFLAYASGRAFLSL